MPVTKKKTKKTAKVMSKAQRMARERSIIKDLRAGKLSYRQIAAKHKVSLPTVNAKARKAGIRRRARVAKTATRAARPATMAARTRRVGNVAERPGGVRRRAVSVAKKPTSVGLRRRKVARRKALRASGRSLARFNEAFRNLVLEYYPEMPLAKFDRLARQVRKAIV